MLKEFLTKTGIQKLLSRIRVEGFTPLSSLRKNRENSKRILKEAFRRAVMGEHDGARFANDIGKAIKSRKANTLTTLRGIMAVVRSESRAVLAIGRSGRFFNVSILDSRTSTICLNYVGESWPKPFSDIPDRPPRHRNCRSILQFVPDGDEPPDARTFMQHWRDDESGELKRDLLKPARYQAYLDGKLTINSVKDYETSVLLTLAEQGLE